MELYDQLEPEREDVARFMRRLYVKNLTTCSGGNISLRVGNGHVLLTPAKLDKGELTGDQILLATLAGENLTPELKPTMETEMHLAVYRARPDVRAIVHAHPVFATAFACTDRALETALTSEIYMHVPKIGYAPFATPGSGELASRVAESLADANVSLMRNHGVTAVADTVYKAFDLLESVETFARIAVAADLVAGAGRGAGSGESRYSVRPLSPSQLRGVDLLCGR